MGPPKPSFGHAAAATGAAGRATTGSGGCTGARGLGVTPGLLPARLARAAAMVEAGPSAYASRGAVDETRRARVGGPTRPSRPPRRRSPSSRPSCCPAPGVGISSAAPGRARSGVSALDRGRRLSRAPHPQRRPALYTRGSVPSSGYTSEAFLPAPRPTVPYEDAPTGTGDQSLCP